MSCCLTLVGHVPCLVVQEPSTRGRPAPTAGGVSFGREEHVCGSALHGGELPEAVHAAGRPSAAGAHVYDSAAL